MKNKTIVILIALFGSVVMLLVSCGEQSKGWKGIIEEVDGITVVKNPREPMYGKEVFSIEEDEEGYQFIKRYKVSWKY